MTNPDNYRSLSYPLGKCILPKHIDGHHIDKWTNEIDSLYHRLSALCSNLKPLQYTNTYRPGGWTIGQLMFHITDSHSHSYIRFKWSLTEDKPLIKAYNEKKWAELQDCVTCDPEESLQEISFIQKRLVRVIKSLTSDDLKKSFIHPESGEETSLAELIGHYAWHGNHHLEHIKIAINHPATDYLPVSCSFYDELVLLATRKTLLKIHIGHQVKKEIYIKDIETSKKEEFLIFSDDTKVRLDAVQLLPDDTLNILAD
jgi:uncharacterized damage-inducible protein DinB/transcriptional antiterminator Rof (Rho-off)